MGYAEKHRTLHGLFNDRDFDAMDAHMNADMTYEDIPRGLTMTTLEEFKDWARAWTGAFSDGRVDAPTYLEGADFSFARFQGRGHNDGPMGPMPATGREMDTPFWELLQYGADGKVVSGAACYDQLTLLTQLGHISLPSSG